MRLLVTGATGKVGQNFLPAFLAADRFDGWQVRVLCNNRTIPETERVRVVSGSLADRHAVSEALHGVTHVLHMAAVKETPDLCMDVAVKGMFQLLETFRQLETAQQFILIGGDCSVGHAFQAYDGPVTEDSPRKAYPGCYALTKVLEETMLEQYQLQYGLNGCILRAPWIMEKDDFRFALSFGPDQFGGPPWTDFLTEREVVEAHEKNMVPLLLDRNNKPLLRNFVHANDLVSAILTALDNPAADQQLFNISMNEPVEYGVVVAHLKKSRSLDAKTVPSPMYSNWLDNSKARQLLGWRPEVDVRQMIDLAWAHERPASDPRKIWYPG